MKNGANGSNGTTEKKQGENVMSLEMESLHPEHTAVRYPQKLGICDQLYLLVRLYAESYPRVASAVGFVTFLFCLYAAVIYSKPPMKRNQLEHQYQDLDRDYTSKLSQMDHWCLFGDDDACTCEDFTDPVSREETDGWLEVHEANKERITSTDDYGIAHYDIVFYGDDLVENLNGLSYNKPIKGGSEINAYFKQQFTLDGEESNVDSIALGITGDSTSNLLWRLQHGEMPEKLDANVFWLMMGTSDLSRGGCSEDATVLGILRLADEIHKAYPQSVVVLQGILPRTSRKDGLLEPRSFHQKLLGKHHTEKYYADMAQHAYLLWPSIQHINKQLELFCEGHEYFVYFDAGAYFLQDARDEKMGKTKQIIKKYMPDYVHLSLQGWQKLGDSIAEEYMRIVWDEDQENEIETNDDGAK